MVIDESKFSKEHLITQLSNRKLKSREAGQHQSINHEFNIRLTNHNHYNKDIHDGKNVQL